MTLCASTPTLLLSVYQRMSPSFCWTSSLWLVLGRTWKRQSCSAHQDQIRTFCTLPYSGATWFSSADFLSAMTGCKLTKECNRKYQIEIVANKWNHIAMIGFTDLWMPGWFLSVFWRLLYKFTQLKILSCPLWLVFSVMWCCTANLVQRGSLTIFVFKTKQLWLQVTD